MSQARAKSFQTVKSLSYLYNKVCKSTNISRRYCSDSSFKALSFVEKFSTLNSGASDDSFDFQNPDDFPTNGKNSSGYDKNWSFRESDSQYDQNPNGVYRETSMGVQRSLSGAYGQSYNYNGNYQNKLLEHSLNRLYEEGRNVQSSYKMNSGVSKEVTGGGNDQYLKSNGMFQESKGSYSNGGDHGLHRLSQYNVNRSYSCNASSNQESSVTNYQIPNGSHSGRVNSHVASYSQLNKKSNETDKERKLLEELDSFCTDRKLKEAVEILGLLEQHNVSVDIPRYLFLMNECGESQALQEAKHIHDHLTRSVPHPDVYIDNKILEMYSRCGSMEDAYDVFDKMPQHNLTSWDTMITWLAKSGHGEDAINMFTEFKRVGLKPDNEMFTGVFDACSVVGDMKEGLLHFESMIKTYNLVPSMDNYVSVVAMLGSSGYLHEALEFIEKMPIKPSVEIWEIMMNQCRLHGDLELGDRCAEIIDLIDPSRLDEKSKEGLIPIKKRLSGCNPLDIKSNVYEYIHKVYEFTDGDTSGPYNERLYNQLRCLKQSMKEVGYMPETRNVFRDVDQESKEAAVLSHSLKLALSEALLTSPARAEIRIINNFRFCADCHNALKIVSKLVGRQIIARDENRFHHIENGVCSCGDYW